MTKLRLKPKLGGGPQKKKSYKDIIISFPPLLPPPSLSSLPLPPPPLQLCVTGLFHFNAVFFKIGIWIGVFHFPFHFCFDSSWWVFRHLHSWMIFVDYLKWRVYVCVYMHFRSLYCCNICFGKKKGVSTVLFLFLFFSLLYWPELCYQVLGEFVEYDRCQWVFLIFLPKSCVYATDKLLSKCLALYHFFST